MQGISFAGIEIIEDPYMTTYKHCPKLPKSKRKRIRMKWLRKYRQYKDVPVQGLLNIEGTNKYLCHPSVAEKLRKTIAR